MNKDHIGKNKSFVSSDSTKIDFKINYVHSCGVCVCVEVLETALLRG